MRFSGETEIENKLDALLELAQLQATQLNNKLLHESNEIARQQVYSQLRIEPDTITEPEQKSTIEPKTGSDGYLSIPTFLKK